MAFSQNSASGPAGPKPAAVSDLLVLVFGVALALSLRWHVDPSNRLPWEPRWRVVGSWVEEAIEKTSLALIPLALWRRARLGGVCRPAELLLAVCAFPYIVEDLNWALWHAEGKREIYCAGDFGESFWRVRGVALSIALAAALGLFLGRRSLGDPAKSALRMLAVASTFPWLLDPLRNIECVLVEANRLGDFGETAVAVASGTLEFLLPATLGAAAVGDVVRRRSQVGAIGWAGLTLASGELIVSLPVNLWGTFMPSIPPLGDFRLHVMYFGGPVVATVLGVVLVATLGPAWSRTFGPGLVKPGPTTDAEASA